MEIYFDRITSTEDEAFPMAAFNHRWPQQHGFLEWTKQAGSSRAQDQAASTGGFSQWEPWGHSQTLGGWPTGKWERAKLCLALPFNQSVDKYLNDGLFSWTMEIM